MRAPTEIARERYAGKRVTVVGLAREGLSLVRFLVGAGAQVTANDRARSDSLAETLSSLNGLPVTFALGGHPLEVFLDAEELFVSPGVPQELPALVEARRRGVPISSETQLFFELCPGRIVGITGSAGKTTTTALVGEMLRHAGLPVHVGGNIGVPLLDRLDEIKPDGWVVLEMSSFQLETLPYSPPIGAILNITPNHLDRHSDMRSYTAAKLNILRHQRPEDQAILSADDEVTSCLQCVGAPLWFSLQRPVEGSYLEGDRVMVRRGVATDVAYSVSDVHLRGRHNLANAVAAVAIASAAGVRPHAMAAAVRGFRGVPHRLEQVGEIGGVSFFNDSIATAPERSIASIHSFDVPVVLIAGGRNKRLPMESWAEVIRLRARALVLMGESADEIERAVAGVPGSAVPPILRASSMDESVRLAHSAALPGEVVLLAPGCTSFDMYRDFEERGEHFRECVRDLGGGDAWRLPDVGEVEG